MKIEQVDHEIWPGCWNLIDPGVRIVTNITSIQTIVSPPFREGSKETLFDLIMTKWNGLTLSQSKFPNPSSNWIVQRFSQILKRFSKQPAPYSSNLILCYYRSSTLTEKSWKRTQTQYSSRWNPKSITCANSHPDFQLRADKHAWVRSWNIVLDIKNTVRGLESSMNFALNAGVTIDWADDTIRERVYQSSCGSPRSSGAAARGDKL